jgi:hypothetical protein
MQQQRYRQNYSYANVGLQGPTCPFFARTEVLQSTILTDLRSLSGYL